MLLGDWSRHEDNWRWSQFDSAAGGMLYKAVPRDRDNIFYKLNDAPVPWLFKMLGLKKHHRTFRASLKNPETLNQSGRNLDELLLAGLSLSAWLAEADSVQRLLTDQVIEEAFKELPAPVYALSAPAIMHKLKARRNQLPQFTRQYYSKVARQVHLTGTDLHEAFVIDYLPGGQVQVKIYKISKKGEREMLLSQSVFDDKITKSIYLYGLDGNDRFQVAGNHKSKMELHLYGGAGEDAYTDEQAESRKRKKLFIHESKYGNTYQVPRKTRININNNPPSQTLDANGALLKYYLD
jgi:hypothetical protein